VIVDILVLNEGSLAANLGTDFVVRKTGCREKRDLLTTSDGVHQVDGGDTSLDHFFGIATLVRVDWLALKNYRS